MIPGTNILNMALGLIASQPFTYHPYSGRTVNDIGYEVSTYGTDVSATGSVQPVPRTLYQQMGLDFQRNYYNFFLAKGVIDVARDVSGDQFTFNGKRFQCISKTDWYAIDGWDQVLAVEVVANT